MTEAHDKPPVEGAAGRPQMPGPPDAGSVLSLRMSQYFLLLVLVAISVVFFNIMKIFLMPVFLAAVFAGLVFPLYSRLLSWTKGRRGLSAFFSCVIFIFALLTPTYFVVDLLRKEVVQLYQTHESSVQQMINEIDSNFINRLAENQWLQKLNIDLRKIDLLSSAKEAVKGVGNLLILLVNKTWTGTFQFAMQLFIMFFTMYYFFKDGRPFIERLKYLSPLHDEHEEMLISRFVSMSRATVKGTLLIGLMQGTFGALLLWLFGFNSPIVAGVVMFFLSIIPMVGAWLVLYPAGAYLLIVGQIWQGVLLIAITALVIGNVDNVVRPKLVGRQTGMHDLLIFFSTIGGMSVFGVMGFIVGPVVAALFLAVLEIYAIEFKAQLDGSSSAAAPAAPAPLEPPAEESAA